MTAPARVAIVGLGQQGIGIAELLTRQGYELVGGVDIGAKVGKRLSELSPGVTSDARVSGSVTELLDTVGDRADVVVLAAAIDLEPTLAQAREVMAAGINVLGLHQDLFEPITAWAAELQAIGESTGASLLGTGVQDTWWVQMPAVAAGSTNNIRRVTVEHLIDVESIAPGIVREVGIGVPESEFGPFNEVLNSLPPILGGPLRVAARALGLVPGEITMAINPIVSTESTRWRTADETLPAGSVIGTEEVTSFSTDAGVEFRGILRLRPLTAQEQPSDIVTIDADPVIRLEHTPFPGQQVTNITLVARIPDVIAARGGVYSAADFGPARYRPPVLAQPNRIR